MSWAVVARVMAYFKDIDEADVLERYCLDKGLPDLPVVVSSADICRDDLLFEIEVDATAGRICESVRHEGRSRVQAAQRRIQDSEIRT